MTGGSRVRGTYPVFLVRGGVMLYNELHDNIKNDYDANTTTNGGTICLFSKKVTVIQVHGIVCTVLGVVVYGLESILKWMRVPIPFLGPTVMVRTMVSFMIGTGLMEVQLSYEPGVQKVFLLLYHVLLVSALAMGAVHQYSNHPSTIITNAMLLTSLLTPLFTAGFGIAGFLF
eukprot:scaffold21162_cov65-Attheya_sp.AAC.4